MMPRPAVLSTAAQCLRLYSAGARRPVTPHRAQVPRWQRPILALSTAIQGFLDPRSGDKVAEFAELTAGPALHAIRRSMLGTPNGRQLLKYRPLLTSETLEPGYLESLPEASFGRRYYVDYMQGFGLDIDARAPVKYVEDEELAYVMLRYRQVHDFLHTLTALPPTLEGELVLKVFEAVQTGTHGAIMPHTLLSVGVGQLRMLWNMGAEREGLPGISRLWTENIPWALQCGAAASDMMTADFEMMLEWDLERVRRAMSIWVAPMAHERLL